jgi:hypothetical protein
MNLNDGDLEFIFALYDSARSLVTEKDRTVWAEETIRHMIDYGIDVKLSATEIGEHCNYLDAALCEHLELEEEDEDAEYDDGEEYED